MIMRSVAFGITGSLLTAAVWLAGTAPASADDETGGGGLFDVLSSTLDTLAPADAEDTGTSLLGALSRTGTTTVRTLLGAPGSRAEVPVIDLHPASPTDPDTTKPDEPAAPDAPDAPDAPKANDRATRDAKTSTDDSASVAAEPVVTLQPEWAPVAAADTQRVARTAAKLPASEFGPEVQAPATDTRSSVTRPNADRALSMPLHPAEQPASLPLVLAIVTLAASAALLVRRWVLNSHV